MTVTELSGEDVEGRAAPSNRPLLPPSKPSVLPNCCPICSSDWRSPSLSPSVGSRGPPGAGDGAAHAAAEQNRLDAGRACAKWRTLAACLRHVDPRSRRIRHRRRRRHRSRGADGVFGSGPPPAGPHASGLASSAFHRLGPPFHLMARDLRGLRNSPLSRSACSSRSISASRAPFEAWTAS